MLRAVKGSHQSDLRLGVRGEHHADTHGISQDRGRQALLTRGRPGEQRERR